MADIVEKLKDACVIDRHYGKSVTLTLDYDDYMEAADLITALRAEVERLRAALKTARPFIGWAGHYPTILAEVDAALEEKQ